MNDVNSVLEISQKLENLNRRLAELDQQRDAIQDEIDECMTKLGYVTARHVPYSGKITTRQLTIAMLNKYSDRPLAPQDIAAELEIDGQTIRGLLARLAREGVVKRSAHGRYQIAKE